MSSTNEKALQEIDEVLRRYELAAVVVVSDQKNFGYRLTFPPWSAVQLEPNVRTPGIDRLKCRTPSGGLDDESVMFLFGLRNGVGQQFDNLQRICAVFESAFASMGLEINTAPDDSTRPHDRD